MVATGKPLSEPAATARRRISRRQGDLLFAWALILPALIMLCVFMIYPILYSLNMSFRRWYIASETGNGV